jgi:DNA modification methylase
MGKKYCDGHWDFRTANTKTLSHGLHTYPAMMIPQVASSLLERHGSGIQTLFDPYCGTGTSLVEASVRGITAIGTDINPLARLISKVKITPVSLKTLDLYSKDFHDYVFRSTFEHPSPTDIPQFPNIDYWFAPRVQHHLALIKQYIGTIDEPDVADFFNVAFSETVRESSWTRNGEFKLFRMTDAQRERFEPNVFGMMLAKLARNRSGIATFIAALPPRSKGRVHIDTFNTVEGIPEHLGLTETVDMVLSSPPYGDSRTTVAYGQYSRLANQWLGYDEAAAIDSLLMGGKIRSTTDTLPDLAESVIADIHTKDAKRAAEVRSFYADYADSIAHVASTIKRCGKACYVVGNRRVKGIALPTDEITRFLFEKQRFTHIETIVRTIPNKRMPSKNSPTNVVGAHDSTMTQEFIVVMQKL